MKIFRIFSELSIFRLAIVAVLVTTAYFFLYYDNGEKIEAQIQQLDGELAGEKTKRADIEKKMKKEEEMRGNLLQLARNLDVVKSKIPNEFNEIEVSSIVNRVSISSQVKIIALKRSAATAAAGVDTTATGAELIEEVNFDIEMSGTFNAIIRFVEFLSKEEKTIKVRNFILEKLSTNLTEDTVIHFKGEIVGFKQGAVAKAAPSAAVAPGTVPPAGSK